MDSVECLLTDGPSLILLDSNKLFIGEMKDTQWTSRTVSLPSKCRVIHHECNPKEKCILFVCQKDAARKVLSGISTQSHVINNM